jgi:Family of unknown function (DUF5335)
MTVRKLDKKDWKPFFDEVSKIMEGKQAEIEVASLKLGDQVEAVWPPLLGLAYDPKDDIFEVALEGVDHLIPKPREIYVDGSAEGSADASGTAPVRRGVGDVGHAESEIAAAQCAMTSGTGARRRSS